MQTSSLIVVAALVCSGAAMAQNQTSVQGNAAAGSQTSVSANRDGASASNRNSASADAATNQATGALAGDTELNASLSKPVDARKNKPGDEVTATVTQDVKSAGEVVIPKGSKLIGRVTAAQARGRTNAASSSESQLGILFERAVLKNGREIPVNAAVQALASAKGAASSDLGNMDMRGAGNVTGAGRASAGGLIGGGVGAVGGVAGGAAGAAGDVAGAGGSSVGGAAGVVGKSAGAVGGLDATGGLTAGSKGVFGMRGLNIASSAAGDAEGSLITSTTRNVRLDSGTRMLLVAGAGTTTTSGAANAASSASGQASTR